MKRTRDELRGFRPGDVVVGKPALGVVRGRIVAIRHGGRNRTTGKFQAPRLLVRFQKHTASAVVTFEEHTTLVAPGDVDLVERGPE